MKNIYAFFLISFFFIVASSCNTEFGYFNGVWKYRHVYGTGNAWRSFMIITNDSVEPLYSDIRNIHLTTNGTLSFNVIKFSDDENTTSTPLTYTGQLNVFDTSVFTPNKSGDTIKPISIKKSRFNVVDKDEKNQ